MAEFSAPTKPSGSKYTLPQYLCMNVNSLSFNCQLTTVPGVPAPTALPARADPEGVRLPRSGGCGNRVWLGDRRVPQREHVARSGWELR